MNKITCTSSACRRNLHCFRPTHQLRLQNQAGACRACGTNPIDWQRLHRRDLHDAAYVVESLHLELIRHKFWLSVKIDSKAVDHAKRKGYDGLAMAARLRIKKSVGPASPAFDGRQTPMEGSGNVIHYAQHATASCCRKCIEYWHGIAQGRALTEDEIQYLTELVMVFIRKRLPFLRDAGEQVPLARRA